MLVTGTDKNRISSQMCMYICCPWSSWATVGSPILHTAYTGAPWIPGAPDAAVPRVWAEGLPSHPEKTVETTFLNNSLVETMTNGKTGTKHLK